MKRVMAALHEDDTETIELEDVTALQFSSKSAADEKDIFKSMKLAPQSQKVKRRVTYLKKKFKGKDGEAKYNDPEAIDGYGLFDVVEPPYNLELLASLFEENAIHNASVMARSVNTVGLGYKWANTRKAQQKVEKAAEKESEESARRVRKELSKEEEKLEDLFDVLNEEDTLTDILVKVWVDYLTTGNGYIEISRNRKGEIGYIGHIPSHLVRVRRQRDGFVQRVGHKAVFYRNFGDRETVDPINGDPVPNELMHFKCYSPTTTYYGVPPIVSAMSAIIGDKFAKEYNIDYFENKAIPRYAIVLKGAKLSQRSKQELINYFKNEIKGNNHGTLVVPLPASIGRDVDLKFEQLENKVQDGSFDKYRKSNQTEILVANRVPATKVGIYADANLAVARDSDKTFKMQVISPDQTSVEKKINRIVKEFSDLKKLEFMEIDIIDEDLRSRIWDRYLRTEVVVPNEVREKLGLPPLPGGDKVLPYPTKKNDNKDKGGAPSGNNNAISGSPPKSAQDSQTGENGPAMDSGTNQEKGQRQDSGENTN